MAAAVGPGCGGDDGSDGASGETGETGAQGDPGATGMDGTQGDKGDPGEPGQQGEQGPGGDAGPAGEAGPAGDAGPPGTSGPVGLNLKLLGRYSTGVFDGSAAEIVDYDPPSQRLFVVNANDSTVDVLDLSDPTAPTKLSNPNIKADLVTAGSVTAEAEVGDANSVSVSDGFVAVAVAADSATANGWVAFYQASDLAFQAAVEVGVLPDMLTFTPDGSKVVVACEGEPEDSYDTDPEGSVAIIDVSGGVASVTATHVTLVGFTDFNVGGSREAEVPADLRIFGQLSSGTPSTVAQDLEPEYVTVSEDSTTAWVTLQENNGVAVIDLSAGSVTALVALGFKDHSLPGNELDVSNDDHGINIRNWPVFGMYQPDAIASDVVAGETYLVTANEGDARDYDGFSEEYRIKDIADVSELIGAIDLDNPTFGDEAFLSADENLGRLNFTTTLGGDGCVLTAGMPAPGCTYRKLYAYGARSFSIWNSAGQLVFDSGHDIEVRLAQRLPNDFNATNDENNFDNRSDDKGPEPEALTVAEIEGRHYAFVGLERVGGIMIYDITNPQAPEFVSYRNDRDFSVVFDTDGGGDPDPSAQQLADVGDLGPEGLVYIGPADSPTGVPLLVVASEVSGTTTIYEVGVLRAE